MKVLSSDRRMGGVEEKGKGKEKRKLNREE